MLATLLQLKGGEKGWEYLAKLHKNVAQYSKSGSAPGQLAGQGEVAIAIVFLHDVVMFAEEGFPLKAIAPADLALRYQIFGHVTSGMDAVDAIAAAADKENPTNPVVMTKVTVSNP